ncbi:hypothetical protein LCGC14_2774140, partial [marine sediment metagenome]
FNNVYNPLAANGNYHHLSPPPDWAPNDLSGEISADPLYVDPANGVFELGQGSPAIDAASEFDAPLTDFYDRPRFDDRSVDNTGGGFIPFVDIGALERGGLPRAVKHSPDGAVAEMVHAIRFTFRGAMDTASFDLGDVLSLTGPAGAIPATGFEWVNRYQLDVSFPLQASVGDYEMVIGPNILDAGGNAMDVDGDGALGEPTDDQYTATFTIVAPMLLSHSPDGFTGGPIEAVRFVFDRAMNPASFSVADDVAGFTGPDGEIAPTGWSWPDARTLEVTFAPQTTLGPYEMVLGPNLLDLGGNPIDQDGDQVYGEVPDDQYLGAFTVADILFVSGTVDADTTWRGVIVVEDNVTVQGGATLTVAPGTIVKFGILKALTVQAGGSLSALGTLAQPIHFTSVRDDTLGGDMGDDGDRTAP